MVRTLNVILRLLGVAGVLWLCFNSSLIWAFLLAPVLFSWTKGWKDGAEEVKSTHLRAKVAIVALAVFVVLLVVAYFAFRVV